MARDAGANKVYFASAAPPVRYPNVYGIDMPTPDELVAHNRDIADITKEIGADWVVYQDLEDVIKAVHHGNMHINQFDTSCFNGEYVTGDIDQKYLALVEAKRSDLAKNCHPQRTDEEEIGLHNGS
ncbi:MAG: hypothetical protein GXP10_03790 [Gammaproteobacteria bacterium]|nr:hypothetical protein [Gammaproteobacteria bacterium]